MKHVFFHPIASGYIFVNIRHISHWVTCSEEHNTAGLER